MKNPKSNQSNGIFNLISQGGIFDNFINAVEIDESTFEPLPYFDYSAFDETYDDKRLKINVNPFSNKKAVFLPGVKVSVQVTAEKKSSSNAFSSHIYTIKLSHASFKWEVLRTFKDLLDNNKLLSKMVSQNLGRNCLDIPPEQIKPDWPLFPKDNDHLISNELMSKRCQEIAEYLEKILLYPPFRDHQSTLELVGVSPLTFIHDTGPSLNESYVLKSVHNDNRVCRKFRLKYAKRWYILKETCLLYITHKRSSFVGYVMLIDTGFTVNKKKRVRAYHGLEIKNLQYTLFLKFRNSYEQNKWYEKIEVCRVTSGKHFNDKSLLPNGSFVPVRRKQLCKWYINAAAYMEHVMSALNNAKEEIFITDWMLSPELFLKRPTEDLQYRLDKILLKKSREGVKIYIMLFKEVKFTVSLWSSRAKKKLTQNSNDPNIKVFRHPEHSPYGVFLWSHHEKMVIIDQSVAFMGGIDLAYARWDDDLHRFLYLSDLILVFDSRMTSQSSAKSIMPRFDTISCFRQIIRHSPVYVPKIYIIFWFTSDLSAHYTPS
ncbi:phospholipase [Brachionus plicatilis]|uniref:phospholipase D n=1 Tax=Brachionus plicatilis TaxID=10195 RepID=A0A3M7S3P2_BRAPC|nr:phospholipase [Brachionus plicatilis]